MQILSLKINGKQPVCLDPWDGATAWTIDPVIKRLRQAISSLGDTPEQIAARLAIMGCRGNPGNPCFCPLTRFLRRQRIGRFQVCIFSVRCEVTARDGWHESFPLPRAVVTLLSRFDNGEFPELVETV